jgi:ubiquinone biosynthesis protein UbiJ
MLPFSFLPTPSRMAVSALNALLRREDWARERLAKHAGKTVRFALGAFTLALTIDSEGLAAQADPAVVPDVTLTVAPEKLPLPRLGGLGGDREAPDFAEATHISGDAALAQVVADLSKQLRWAAWWAISPPCVSWAARARQPTARARPARGWPKTCLNTWPKKAACWWAAPRWSNGAWTWPS